MKLKERVKKILDEQRLDKEIKIARKKIEDKNKEKEKVQVVKINNEENEKVDKENLEKSDDVKKAKINLDRLKDVGLIVVAITLIGIGYTNFSGGNSSENELELETVETSAEYSNNLGDVQLVNAEEGELVENDNSVNNSIEETSSDSSDSSTNETSGDTSTSDITAYFTELKLNRDNIYSQKLEAYQQIVDSSSISSEQKAIAIQEIQNITETQNSISVAEELIKLKGFENVVIYVNDNAVTVIVRSATLTSDQVAQIQNIVTRQLDVSVSNISISNK